MSLLNQWPHMQSKRSSLQARALAQCCRFFLLIFLGLSVIPEIQSQDAPAATKEEVLEYADLLYSQKQYAIAARQYQIFLKEKNRSPNAQAAWFRLGECYLQVNQNEDAQTTFNYLINEFKTGPFVGSAAYRLAVMRFNTKDYRNAVAYFQLASKELSDEKAKLQSRFYYARSLQLTQQAKEALAQFDLVLKAGSDPEKNPFYERCLMESARLHFDMGDTDKALERFEKLAKEAKTQEFKEEALVRGGLLAAEADKPDISEKLLDQALRLSDTSPWKSLAQVGAIFNAFSRSDYDKVIGIYNTGAYDAPEESRPKMLLVVGHAFRMKGDLDSAVRLYSLVETKFPDRTEGAEAGYRKLQIHHQQGDESLPAVAAKFIESQRRADPTSAFIDLAWLMKAEWHFNKAENSAGGKDSKFAVSHYEYAAKAYGEVRDANVDKKFHEVRLYKQGWSEVESGSFKEGIQTLSRFIRAYPKGSLASSALAKRATSHQSLNDHTLALEDFKAIVRGYPDAPEMEFAMQQVALIQAHLRLIPDMIASYQALLQKFPETSGAAEAHYWMGVGRFDQEEYQKAVPNLEKAREMDSEEYADKATLRLVLAQYQLEDIDKLAKEAKTYIDTAPPADVEKNKTVKRTTIPPQILEYLGRKLVGANDFEKAEFFLTALVNPDEPEKTTASIWKLLAESRVETKKHQGAIDAFDHFLVQTKRPSERASAYLDRGQSQLCLSDYAGAKESARESLRSQKEGRTNAEARILMGDVAAAEGDLEEAAREYLIVSQIFMDREVTPKALTKAANAYLSLGKQDQAEKLRGQLTQQFPDYKVPEKIDDDC